ncbi:MAG: peptide deformylase [Rhodospirillales bacterium]|nr:peptide deformylase [Rhodospirillales bacterium]
MAILKIARMGHPVLSRVADPVADPTAPEIHMLVEDMVDTMIDAPGTGLAAPQVHVPLRVVVFLVRPERTTGIEGDTPVDLTALINPVLEPIGTEMNEGYEGCLSVPGLTGSVPRYTHLRYRGLDLKGNTIDRTVSGFHARVVQHECDHLDGILYPQRMTDLSKLAFVDEMRRRTEK